MPFVVFLWVLGACAPVPTSGRSGANFDPGQLAKTDIDRVADATRHEIFASLRLLAEKLYRRNPREWKKGGAASENAAMARLFDPIVAWHFAEFEGRYGTDALQLAFRDDYRGDRVLALIAGLGGMMHIAFNDRTEFYVIDDIDPQKLYNSARNVEIAVWRLSHAHYGEGGLFLVSNEAALVQNLSFEREFGKIIGHLDLLSKIIADKTNRNIVKMIQSLATAVFLPVAAFR